MTPSETVTAATVVDWQILGQPKIGSTAVNERLDRVRVTGS